MRVIVVGAGEVGYHVADRLAGEKHDVVVVDIEPDRLEYVESHIDVATLEGNGASPAVLRQARVHEANLLIAVSSNDEVNLICCAAARDVDGLLKIARVSNPDYYRGEGKLHPEAFGVDVMINPEGELALETFRMLQTTAARDIAVFAGGSIQIVGLLVKDDAPAAGRSLIELSDLVGRQRMLTVAVKRGEETIVPTGTTVIEGGDVVYVASMPESVSRALEMCGYQQSELKRVMVAGSSREAFYFARLLNQHGIQSVLLVKERAHAQDLAERLERTLILHGDATDIELLELEGVGGVDAFIALTDDDETNILSALVAKDIGAKQVVTLVNNSEYAPLVHRIGLDAAVSPRLSAANAILRHVRRGSVNRLAMLKDIDGEAISFTVAPHSPLAGNDLAGIEFPEGAIVAGLVRGSQVMIPRGSDVLKVGDNVIVFSLPGITDKVARLFPT